MQADLYAGSAKKQRYPSPCCRVGKVAACAQVSGFAYWEQGINDGEF